jgi:hypothetical protein
MKDIPTSPRVIEIRHKRRVRIIRMIVLLVILLVATTWALSYFSYDKHVTIDNVVVTGNHIIYGDDIKKVVTDNISGKYIYLFSKSNSFIYPHKKIYNKLLLEFPRIESLSINIDNLKTLHVNIIERTGAYLYCGEKIPETKTEVGENCYFINDDGFVLDKAPYFSGNVYFKYYMAMDSGADNPVGKQVVSADEFHRITRFINRSISLDFKPIYILIGNDGINHLYLENKSGDTIPEIIFKDDDDFELLQDNLSAAMSKEEFASEIKSKYNTLLYIDLRFDNKVLYKFK